MRINAIRRHKTARRTPLVKPPVELRFQIYSYTLQSREVHIQDLVYGHSGAKPPPLSLVSKASYAEARDYILHYETHTVYLAGWKMTSFPESRRGITNYAARRLEALRTVLTLARRVRLIA